MERGQGDRPEKGMDITAGISLNKFEIDKISRDPAMIFYEGGVLPLILSVRKIAYKNHSC